MDARAVLSWLERRGSRRAVLGLARYGIPTEGAFGVPVGALLTLSKRLGKDQALSAALWASGRYEARLLAAMVGDPQQVTRRQMNAWARDFDSWGVCDTVCWHLFERTPLAWEKARQWSGARPLFVKRAGFALMAGLALHDKAAPERRLLELLPLVERGAHDERDLVKKAVSWALRAIGERTPARNAAALEVARRLAQSETTSCRWVGKDAARALAGPKVRARLARRAP